MKNLITFEEIIKNLREEFSTDLEIAVIEDLRNNAVDMEELKTYITDVLNYGCQSGTVSSMIYYADTEKFFKTHGVEIMDLIQELNEEYGYNVLDNITISANNLAWLAYEEITRKVANYLEIEY